MTDEQKKVLEASGITDATDVSRYGSGHINETYKVETAQTMLKDVYPEWAEKIELFVPDEHFRRLGQSVAAAQIPVIKKAPAKKAPCKKGCKK